MVMEKTLQRRSTGEKHQSVEIDPNGRVQIRSGIAVKSKGVRFGRPQNLNLQQAKLAKRLLDEGTLVSEIAQTFGVRVATIYRPGAAAE
jgi:hypothetical protein